MCDYSLCGLPTRLAVEGEELVVHRFRSGSMGLAAPADLCLPVRLPASPRRKGFWNFFKNLLDEASVSIPEKAICVPPGAQLVLKNIPEDLQRRWKVREEEDVFFVQTSASEYSYRDAIRFSNGLEVLLQSLREGLPVQILSLGDAAVDYEGELAVPIRY